MSDETTLAPEVREGQRIAKVMARAGLCSRRDAEAWIAAGRVSVNGKALDSPAYNISEGDDVRVDGKPLAARERTRLFLFHKPRGLVTTARDPEGRQTIFDALPPDLPRLIAVGRLDINTEGLLLLTNDGGLARVLELPQTGWLRRYRVRAHGRVDQSRLDALSDGVTVDGIDYAAIEARLDREQGSNVWITMGLREGKNREIKKVLEHLRLSVNRLIRVSFGPFELGDLAEGEIAEAPTRVLRDQLGAKLARQAGVDFDAPIVERGESDLARRKERRVAPEPSQRQPSRLERAPGRTREPGEEGRRKAGREVAAQRGPPPSTRERRRKHISALRAEIAEDARGSRKRIERGATLDRKGRTIAVERISPAGRERSAAEIGGPGKAGRTAPDARRGRHSGPKRKMMERPRRPDAFEIKQVRNGEGRERPPRAEPHKSAKEQRGADHRTGARGKGLTDRTRRKGRERASAGRGWARDAVAGGREVDQNNAARGVKSGGTAPRAGRAAPRSRGRPPTKRPPQGPGGRPPRKP
jgi:23S rRNA pseudouridine2605 synthase